jgi:diguanylate cyclase (GGDEF)-like protein/PAS domain S-box-containing protein
MANAGQESRSRLDAVKYLACIDSPPAADFARLVGLLARICDTPIAVMTLADAARHRVASCVGLPPEEAENSIPFCMQAIECGRMAMIADARSSTLLANNALVTGKPAVRFFAGVPLVSSRGVAFGALTVMDSISRTLTDLQTETLHALAAQAAAHIECGLDRSTADPARAAATQAGIVKCLRKIAAADLDLQAVMDLMVEQASLLTGATGGAIELIEGDSTVYRATAGSTAGSLGMRLNRETSLFGRAAAIGTAVLCNDTETDERVDREACLRLNVRSVIVAPLRVGSQFAGALKVVSDRPRAFSQSDMNILQILAESLGNVMERQRATERLRASEAQYRQLFNNNPHPMWVYETATLRVLAVNRAAVKHYGYTEQEFLSMTLRDLRPAEDVARLEETVNGMSAGKNRGGLWRHIKKNGTVVDAEVVDQSYDFIGNTARLVLATDVTERLRTARELARMSRAQHILSDCNEALTRIEDEGDLLENICRVCVDIGGYRMAWVGFVQHDASRSILPVARAGEDRDYLDRIPLSWDDSSVERSPAGRAIHTNQAVIVEDLSRETGFALAPDLACQRGFRGVVCLPLRNRERSFGVLCLYLPEVTQVSADEVKLLQALADNLAFGIINIRSREERRQLQLAAVKVAAGVAATSGTEFFTQLASNMAEALGAQGAFVAQLLPDDPWTARTVVAIVDGEVLENFDYTLRGTPCEKLMSDPEWIVPDNVAALFPASLSLTRMGMRSYVGRRLDNAAGQPAGILFVLFRQPLRRSDLIVSILRIFATRASSELERREADARIREQASLLDKAQDAIVVRGLDDRVHFWNKGAERLYGWTSTEASGQLLEQLLYSDPAAYREMTRDVMLHGERTAEIEERRKDGSAILVEARWTLVRDEQGRPQSIFAIKTDITKRKAAEREIQYLAFYDPLTRLPNRLLLMDRLQQAMARSARSGRAGALLFIDLDNFKTINDTLGHDMGDLLLQQVALRLVKCVRDSDTVARLGGDEFVVLLEQLGESKAEGEEHVRGVGKKILAALNQPFRFDRYEHHSTPSIGIALFSNDHDSPGDLLKQADLAMYQAKAAGRNTLRYFAPGMQAAVSERAALETDLRQSLRENEFVLHYQPQVDGAGKMTGVEALVRWRHPVRGMVSPAEFIPLAEETGLILALGQWVLETACMQLAAWAACPRAAHLDVAVNVSARQFRHPDFFDQVVAALARTGANPHRLKLELTESVMVENVEDTIEKMTALKARGIGFSLDDFGTGYSSLSYLKRLPLDMLKIDRSFVSDGLSNANEAAIAKTIIALGQSLGLAVIAEGVETLEQKDFLARNGCHAYQGYLFGRPMELAALEEFMKAQGPAAP